MEISLPSMMKMRVVIPITLIINSSLELISENWALSFPLAVVPFVRYWLFKSLKAPIFVKI